MTDLYVALAGRDGLNERLMLMLLPEFLGNRGLSPVVAASARSHFSFAIAELAFVTMAMSDTPKTILATVSLTLIFAAQV